MLRYLAEHFTGLSEEMERIRRAMEGFDLSTTRITEKILRQLLYTGARLPEETSLLETHLERGGDIELAAALLARNAHYALTRMEELPRGQFDRIGRFGREGVPLADMCRIAYLRQLADRAGEVTHFEQEVSRLFLDDLLREGIVFPFYRQFMGFVPKLQDYANETLVEYRDKSRLAKRVVYHFAMEENGARGEFATREMTEMYEGWYVTGFTLFFGEQMHYFITDDEEETNIVESGTIGQDARLPEQTEDRFGRVNDIAYLAAMHKDSEALHTLREYDHLSFLVGRLFPAGKQ